MTVGREAERTQRAIEALRKARESSGEQNEPAAKATKKAARKAAAQPAQDVSTEQASQSEATAAEPPKQAEPPPDYETKLARALTGAQKAEHKALETERALAEARRQLAAAQELEQLFATNPLEALKRKGLDLESLNRGVLEGKFKATDARDVAQEAQQAEVAELKKLVAVLREERETERSKAVESQELEIVATRLRERAESSPVVAALSWAPTVARSRFYAERNAGREVDLDAVIQQMNAAAEADVRAVLSDERATRALLADKKIRETIAKALGRGDKDRAANEPQAKPGKDSGREDRESPRTLISEHAASSAQSTSSRLTDAQRKRAALAALQRLRS